MHPRFYASAARSGSHVGADFAAAARVPLQSSLSRSICVISMPTPPSFPCADRDFCVALLRSIATAVARAEPTPPVLLVVGDSISAGYGLAKGHGMGRLARRAHRSATSAVARRQREHHRRHDGRWAARACPRFLHSTSRGSSSSSWAATTDCAEAICVRRRTTSTRWSRASARRARAARDRHETASQLRPRVHARIRGAVRRRREGEPCGARAVLLRGVRRVRRVVPARPRPSDGGGASQAPRQRMAGARRRSSRRRDEGGAPPDTGLRATIGRLRWTSSPRIQIASTSARPPNSSRTTFRAPRTDPCSTMPSARGSGRCTRRNRDSPRSARARHSSRATSPRCSTARSPTSRGRGRPSSIAGAAASAAARSRIC